jgi:hypothetical protein
MTVEQVVKFIGLKRALKLDELDVYLINDVWCIDAMSLEEWTDCDNSHTFVYEGYDVTNREMMVTFRDWLDELTEAA